MGRTRNPFTFKKRQKEIEKKNKKEEKIKQKMNKRKPLCENEPGIEENPMGEDVPDPEQ